MDGPGRSRALMFDTYLWVALADAPFAPLSFDLFACSPLIFLYSAICPALSTRASFA